MKPMATALLALLCLGVTAGCMQPKATTEALDGVTANVDMARELAQALGNHDWQNAVKHFDGIMQDALSQEKLAQVWKDVAGKQGAFKNTGAARVEYVQGMPVVFVRCNFEKGALDVQVSQSPEGAQVTGLFIRPAGYSFL